MPSLLSLLPLLQGIQTGRDAERRHRHRIGHMNHVGGGGDLDDALTSSDGTSCPNC
jgi:hypothetical protein